MKPLRTKVLLFSLMLMFVSCFTSVTASADNIPVTKIELSDHQVEFDAVVVGMNRFETKS